MKNSFRHPIEVSPQDIDGLGHVNNVVYLQWIQDTAGAHWLSTAPAETQQKVRWVVHRHQLTYLKPAFEGDKLTGHTWVEKMEGVRSIRRVNIMRGQEILLEALTHWIMVNSETMKPQRISEDLAQLFI